MRMVDLIQSKSKADWVVWSVRLGLRASSVAMVCSAVAACRRDQLGEGLVYFGLALAHFIFAAADLREMWNSRHMNMMCAARANPASAPAAIGAWIAYLLIISGVVLQYRA